MGSLSSQARTYAGLCIAVVIILVVLLSNSLGESVNTTYGSINQDMAIKAGIPLNANLLGESSGSGYVINQDAGAFVHLPYGAALALTWTMLAGLLLLVLSGVRQRSLAMSTLPGLTFVVVATMIGGGYLALGPDGSPTQYPVLSVAILTGIGVLACVVNNHYRAFVARRTPDTMPTGAVDVPRERTTSA